MKKILTTIFVLTSFISFGQDTITANLWKSYTEQKFNYVIENATPLLQKDPGNIDLNLMLGRSYSDIGNFKKAIPYLEETVKKDTANTWCKPWALAYLGTCYFMEQKYDASKKNLNECINLNILKNPTNYAYGLTLLFGYNAFYDNWKIVESDHFRFHFQKMTDADIEKYVLLREQAYNLINDFFNNSLPKKIDFFVWNSRDDAKALLKTDLGFAKPTVCVVHSYYQQTIGHEMTHVISEYTSTNLNKTRFINEGTAVYFDQSGYDKMLLVKEWVKNNNKIIIIKDLWAGQGGYPDELVYPVSGLFVKKLVDNFGRDKFLDFFKNQTYENAKLVFGENIDLVIKAFEKEMNE